MGKKMGRTQRKRRQRKFAREDEIAASLDMEAVSSQEKWLPELVKELPKLGWRNPNSLCVRSFGVTGRGLCSKRKRTYINDELIRLPFDCLISISTLEADESFKALFPNTNCAPERRLNCQTLLALYLLFQRHRNDNELVRIYLKTLPISFTTPFFCSMDELQCLPDSVIECVLGQNRRLRQSHANMCELLTQKYCSCCHRLFADDIFAMKVFKWAYFVVNTRSIYADIRHKAKWTLPDNYYFSRLLADAPNTALAPFLDLFNHSDEVINTAALEPGGDFVIRLIGMTRIPAVVPAREQLFMSYGCLNDLQLLTEYGIVMPKNRHNIFQIALTDIQFYIQQVLVPRGVTFDSQKFRFIRGHKLDEQMYVSTRDPCMSHNLHVVLHLLFHEPNNHMQHYKAVAFGDINQLNHCRGVLQELITNRLGEMQDSIAQLEKLAPLSAAGSNTIEYMHITIRYLQNVLRKLNDCADGVDCVL